MPPSTSKTIIVIKTISILNMLVLSFQF